MYVSDTCSTLVSNTTVQIFLCHVHIHMYECLYFCLQEELQAVGTVVKSGRNVTVVVLEFKQKKTGKLIYTARTTFYNLPVSKL